MNQIKQTENNKFSWANYRCIQVKADADILSVAILNNDSFLVYLLQIFYPKNRTQSILRIEMRAHEFYPKNRLTKHSSILRIESYYTSALTCLHCLVLFMQLIYNTLNIKYMMIAQYYIILYRYEYYNIIYLQFNDVLGCIIDSIAILVCNKFLSKSDQDSLHHRISPCKRLTTMMPAYNK